MSRRTLLIIAGAIPTMLIAGVVVVVLMRFLATRDQLGTWTITLTNDHDAARGQGRLDLVPDGWTTVWSGDPPFLTFQPFLVPEHAGSITFNHAALDDLAKLTGAPWPWDTCPLEFPWVSPDGSICMVFIRDPDPAKRKDSLQILFSIPGATSPPLNGISWIGGKPALIAWHCILTR